MADDRDLTELVAQPVECASFMFIPELVVRTSRSSSAEMAGPRPNFESKWRRNANSHRAAAARSEAL